MRSNALARVAAWAMLALAPGAHGIARAEGSVVVLKSGALAAYDATAAGFRTSYAAPALEIQLDTRATAATRRAIDAAIPEVIVAIGAPAAEFTRRRFPSVPLVFVVVHDPERYDLTGATVTGVMTDVPERVQLEALRRIAPDVRRVAMVRGDHAGAAFLHVAKAAAAGLSLELVDVPVRAPSDVAPALRGLVSRADALWLPADPAVATPEVFRFVLQLSLERKIPLLVFSEAMVRAGALIAVAPDYGWAGARAAEMVQRIRTGERAGDLPHARLERTRVVVNPSTARALGRDPAAATDGEDAR